LRGAVFNSSPWTCWSNKSDYALIRIGTTSPLAGSRALSRRTCLCVPSRELFRRLVSRRGCEGRPLDFGLAASVVLGPAHGGQPTIPPMVDGCSPPKSIFQEAENEDVK